MQFKRFPEFGEELRRPFQVHENCYDCAEFYDGCKGWRVSRDFACKVFNRLPDVMPGIYGQVFPPSRRSELTRDQRPDRAITPGRNHPELLSAACEFAYAEGASFSPKIHEARVRVCGCGAALPKGKRLCDLCRAENRRQTRRDYMRTYMEQRRSAAVDAGSDVPFPATATPSTRASDGDLALTGLPVRGGDSGPTSVLTKGVLTGG
jgi:hypothetical protein